MVKLLFSISLLFAFLHSAIFAIDGNNIANTLKAGLIEKGFENVSVICKDQQIIITYENRKYRYEIRAIREILKSSILLAKEDSEIILIPQYRRIPLAVINMSSDICSSFSKSKLPSKKHEISDADETDSVWGMIKSSLSNRDLDEEHKADINVFADPDKFLRQTEAISDTRFFICDLDLVFYPQFNAQYGDFAEPLKSQVNIAPEARITLWKGMSLSGQLIIPLQNELGEESDHIRPGILTLNQAFLLPRNFLISATAGYFTHNRYGLDIELKKCFINGMWYLGANVGYTGYASYLKNVWYCSDIDYLNALFIAEHRIPKFDTNLSVAYGKFLYRDRGWRFDILRQFDEVNISFFAILTKEGHNGGFSVSLPLPPTIYPSIGPVRVMPAKAFFSEYRYKGLTRNGVQYSTGNRIAYEYTKTFNPDYIEKQIGEF